MAQKFVGFKPETIQNKILPALGYNGPTDEKSINLFLAANPAAAAKMGKYTMAARQMVEGRPMIKASQGAFSGPAFAGIRSLGRDLRGQPADNKPTPRPVPVYTAPVV